MADSQRKSYNLFDKDNADIRECYVWNDRNYVASSPNTRSAILACKPNTTYTVSKTLSDRFAIAYTNTDPTLDDNTPAYGVVVDNDATSLTITTGGSAQYLVIFFIYIPAETKTVEEIVATIMVNEGQTAKPYEPYGWVHSLRKLTTATEAIENPLYSDGTAITAYTIKGNTVQSGTPTPSNPVEVNGVGNKTANLWNEDYTGIMQDIITYLPLNVGDGDYTLSSTVTREGQAGVLFFLAGNVSTGATTVNNGVWNGQNRTVTAVDGYVTIGYRKYSYIANPENAKTMLNTGSTAQSYEPYGYKIPILNGQQTTNIYLGSVQSERQVYKMILTGNETWQLGSGATPYPYIAKADMPNVYMPNSQLYCTHFQNGNDGMTIGNSYALLTNYTGITTDIPSWKQWLADQYAAGTPVTVWYVLQTPTTGIVNEPLMKIGDYADTLSNATAIPTTEGANSITVDTTVQPSEFTATWSGWHNAYVKEKSENLFDGTLQGGVYKDAEFECEGDINVYKCAKVHLDAGTYTFSFSKNVNIVRQIKDGVFTTPNIVDISSYTFTTTTSNDFGISFRDTTSSSTYWDNTTTIMLNTGSTALPYAPYWE